MHDELRAFIGLRPKLPPRAVPLKEAVEQHVIFESELERIGFDGCRDDYVVIREYRHKGRWWRIRPLDGLEGKDFMVRRSDYDVVIMIVMLAIIPMLIIAGVNAIRRRRERVASAPGSDLLQVAAVLFSQRDCERIFEQVIADMRQEYFDALQCGQPWVARGVRVRGTIAVMTSMGRRLGLHKILATIRRLGAS